jgi:hypothetical protein
MSEEALPSTDQIKQLNEMIARAFVEMRCLGWAGKGEQVADLADAFHNIPTEMHGVGKWEVKFTRAMLQFYQEKYHSEIYSGMTNYVAWVDRIFAGGLK